ncbi:MAG: hypothetical protein ACI8P0_004708, partial [Planctomycetaceae bacterium]
SIKSLFLNALRAFLIKASKSADSIRLSIQKWERHASASRANFIIARHRLVKLPGIVRNWSLTNQSEFALVQESRGV